MTATAPILLLLGAGANIGQSVARAFAAKGYKVALASRSGKGENSSDQVYVQGDFADPDSVASIFSKVKELLGTPSVVVYNAGAATANEAKHPFSLPYADFARDLNINTSSAFVAAQQAVRGFEQLDASASRTFIYTGNITNETPIAPLLDLGVGKSATAHIIESASKAYAEKGYKFYYADERNPDGTPAYYAIDGAAHGELYVGLSEDTSQGPWQQTFVKGVGYKDFRA